MEGTLDNGSLAYAIRRRCELAMEQKLLFDEAVEKEQIGSPSVIVHAGCGGDAELDVRSLCGPDRLYHCTRCTDTIRIPRSHHSMYVGHGMKDGN